ncbi:auxin-responsive protein IAA29-like [Benincasa hispida]|uniref:auxin-responsive protein IAA29-like n=1 Tax=Benincasa hispida TaxID=102211 RepID=UPI001900D2F1|nr:auxin-responsive protein IAA29-like [Benincasa hispida]
MELQLGLPLPFHNHPNIHHKPAFQDPFIIGNQLPQTLPLLSWNDKPKDQDDPPHPRGTHFSNIQKKDEEKKEAVGWPPIESWRKKVFHWQPQPPQTAENRRPVVADQSSNQNDGQNSLFVKVKMEGVAIARKLDLRLYHSHQSLKTALIAMFTTYKAIDHNGWDFTIIYEDQDGDWILAEDLPWNSFVESVQRLKILVRKRNKE